MNITAKLSIALDNAANAANEAYLSRDRYQIAAAYVQLNNVAALCRNNNHFFMAHEANDMADDLSYHF